MKKYKNQSINRKTKLPLLLIFDRIDLCQNSKSLRTMNCAGVINMLASFHSPQVRIIICYPLKFLFMDVDP